MSSTRLLVLPEDWSSTSTSQKFLRLPHPRHGLPSLFLPHPEGQSILEVQHITPPAHERRSAFVDDQVVSDASPYLLTPVDPVFLVIALLQTLGKRSLPAADLFDEASNTWRFQGQKPSEDGSPNDLASEDIVKLGELPCVQDILNQICEVTEVSEEIKTYHMDMDKVVAKLRTKIDRVAEATDSFPTLARALAKEGLLDTGVASEVLKEGRLQMALDMVASYLPESVEKAVQRTLPSEALDAHLASRQDLGLPPGGDPIPSGTSHGSKTEKNSNKAGKKGKKQLSRGVSELSKVWTTNSQRAMMSSFFTKAPPRPASAPPSS